jgi:hypothetical protein
MIEDNTLFIQETILKGLTKEMFHFLGNVETDWQDGWRPFRELGSGDILFRSPLGSYVRIRRSEQGDENLFIQLASLCDTMIEAPTDHTTTTNLKD